MTGAGDNLPPLREVIATYELSARKSLGQNFLLDLNLTRRIARTAGDLSSSHIYEVGPGPGGLTRALLMEGAASVTVIELDPRAIKAIEDVAKAYPGRLSIVQGDAMKAEETALLQHGVSPVRIVANLPYNVGTALLVKWMSGEKWPPFWSSLTLMFQREVAERIVAEPGGKDYGRLSILCQFRAKPRVAFDVPPRAFVPQPKVVSSIVHIEPAAPLVEGVPFPVLERVTAAAFNQRRKMLRSSLKSIIQYPEKYLEISKIDPTCRAEDISVEAFGRLAAAMTASNNVTGTGFLR